MLPFLALLAACKGLPAVESIGAGCTDGPRDIAETCNGRDDDCDGEVDEDFEVVDLYEDADGDGYGGDSAGRGCSGRAGWATDASDCDDSNASIHPGASEIWYDGVDQDCDAGDDYDADGDGYDSERYSGGDCDDADPGIHPEAGEVCGNGLDDDCGGGVDDAYDWYSDEDGDGYGVTESLIWGCDAPAGHVRESGDCDDGDAAVSPSAVDICDDGIDQDCDAWDDWCDEVDAEEAAAVFGDEGRAEWSEALAVVPDVLGDGGLDLCLMDSDESIRVISGAARGTLSLDDAVATLLKDDDEVSAGGRSGAPPEHCVGLDDASGEGQGMLVGLPSSTYAYERLRGEAYLYRGPLEGTDTLATRADAIIMGSSAEDYLAWSMCDAGDLTGDGEEDFVLGAFLYTESVREGAVYVFSSSVGGELDASEAPAMMVGQEYDMAGSDVSAGADLDGDGAEDLIIGAMMEWAPSEDGRVYVVPGPLPALTALADVTTIEARNPGDHLWSGLSTGDADGDGYEDLLVNSATSRLGSDRADAGDFALFLGPIDSSRSVSDAVGVLVETGEVLMMSPKVGDLGADDVLDLLLFTRDTAVDNSGVVLAFELPFEGTISFESAWRAYGAGPDEGMMLGDLGDVDEDGFVDLLATQYRDEPDAGWAEVGLLFLGP